MGHSFYCSKEGEEIDTAIPICGSNEACEYWHPVIDLNHLELLRLAFTGYLEIDETNIEQFKKEVVLILNNFKRLNETEGSGDFDFSIERCQRLLDLLEKYPPEQGYYLSVG
ncbi:hypothetical protein [Gimesia maris]|uniref:hypothetical protein n=1 Tax=Gimesia maris TaxID=122 RepID=UPI000E80E07B|nr:hypothetical protein [Gimesia maris]HAW26982.1 hypothetical protein [Planctomycetaceae bacterium]